MSTADSPSPSGSRTAWLVWIVPLVALIASLWLLHRQYREHGPIIELEFTNGAGIEAGKTPVIYKGVTVGLVRAVELKPNLAGLVVRVELDKGAATLAAVGTDFWLVHPEIGFSGVHGLDTLLSGVQIHTRPGHGAPALAFKALVAPPTDDIEGPGRNFVLRSDTLSGLQPGAGVYYRDVKVGAVLDHRLSPDATQVLIHIKVQAPYDRLVRKESRFWNAGGISMKIGLTGATVRSHSLESLVAGGVSFATPEPDADSKATPSPAPENTVFDLNPEAEKSWLKWKPSIPLETGN